jgi:hypothetical protein
MPLFAELFAKTGMRQERTQILGLEAVISARAQ